jgi:hypothetical protein
MPLYIPSGAYVAFSAYANTTTSVGAGQTVKVAFGAEEFDLQNNFSTSNSRFTAPARGIYILNAHVWSGSTPTDTLFEVMLYKNGGDWKRLEYAKVGSSGSGAQIGGTVIAQLNAGDYIEVMAYANQAVTISASSAFTYFCGAKIG